MQMLFLYNFVLAAKQINRFSKLLCFSHCECVPSLMSEMDMKLIEYTDSHQMETYLAINRQNHKESPLQINSLWQILQVSVGWLVELHYDGMTTMPLLTCYK